MRLSGTTSASSGGRTLLFLVACLLTATSLRAQVVAEPILAGQAFVGDSVLDSGTVVLHRMSSAMQGEVDSMALAPDGSFVFRLPGVPNEAAGDMYFASVRHDGVMYFGNLISRAVDLDSLYVINAYDTLIAPTEGVPVALEGRTLFFEPNGEEWAITDVFNLRNDLDRTVVPPEGGWIWSYPLPEGAREVSAQNEMSADIVTQVGQDIVFRAALPPGPRLLVLRYFVDSLGVTIPTPGETEALDVLVREPAPSIAIDGLEQEQSVQIESGSTFRVFTAEGVEQPDVRITLVEETPPPPVEWIAVVLALVLLGGGLLALRGAPRVADSPAPAGGQPGREAILLEIARLDEEYEREGSPSDARRREYRRRRAELMRRLGDQS